MDLSEDGDEDAMFEKIKAENAEVPEFYDPEKDEKDSLYVQQNGKPSNLITDGTLSCSCCFSVISYECQQHVEYHNQFRCINVKNAKVKYDKVLLYDIPMEEGSGQEKYYPVCCGVCGYECGVFGPGEEEVYHFFDVICGEL